MRVGGWNVLPILEGTFGLDGGSMFGVVPKPVWSRRHPADEQNRITLGLRALLVVGPDRRILVDCGIGDRLDPKQQQIYRFERRPGGLLGALENLGIRPEGISDVIATHLHFDHVGGLLTRAEDGKLVPTFPKATVHLQVEGWAWSQGTSVWDRGSFFGEDFEVWEKKLSLHLLRGDSEIARGVQARVTNGHTPGHQIVVVSEGPRTVVFCSDLIPTASHIRLPYIMAYDHLPLVTLEEKEVLLAQALEEDWVLCFGHDPWISACRLEEHQGRVIPGEQVCLNTNG